MAAPRPDEDQLANLIDEARAVLDILEHGRQPTPSRPALIISATTLLQRSRQRVRDGHRTSTINDGSPGSVLDDEGVPMPPVNDRTGELAAANVDTPAVDPVRRAAATVFRGLTGAVGDLRMAHSALASVSPNVPADVPGCKSCARIDQWEPIHRSERCRWCYDWQLEWREDPPEPILIARREGRRITTGLVREVMGSRRRERRRAG